MRIALILLLIALLTPLRAAAAPAPASQPASDEIKKLIDQLGDNDYPKREEAAKKLKAVGKPALPALKEAIAGNEDPEVVSRAQALVKRIEIRPLPAADPAGGNGMLQATRMRMPDNGN